MERLQPANRRGPAPRPAFSLLELVVVLAIMAVLSAIAVPRYARSVERYRADAAARRIIADLEYARTQARTTGSAQTVSFDVAGDRYVLVGMTHIDHSSREYDVDLAADPYRVQLGSADFDVPLDDAELPEEVVFDGYGTPDSGGTVVVVAGSASRSIVLDPDTGKATVQ